MQAHEQRLKHFAKSLAKAMEVPEVASYLKQEIGKKFGGDYDALWKTVKGKSFPGKGSLLGHITSNLKGWNVVFHSMADVEQVPKLQIALPVGFEEWDGVTPIKVAYTPLTIDDVDLQEIYAYDSSGEEYVLDAQTPPDFPVMVVGINERTDDDGNVTFGTLALPCEECGGGGGGGGGGSHNHGQRTLTAFKFIGGDRDPWPFGKGEVYTVAAGTISGKTDKGPHYNEVYLGKMDDGVYYAPNAQLFNWIEDEWGPVVGYGVLEKDGWNYDWIITSLVENTSVTIDDGFTDDFIGNINATYFLDSSPEDYSDFDSVTEFTIIH